MPLWLPFAVVMAIIAVISGVVVYGVSLVNKVEDSIRPDDSTPTIEEEVKTSALHPCWTQRGAVRLLPDPAGSENAKY